MDFAKNRLAHIYLYRYKKKARYRGLRNIWDFDCGFPFLFLSRLVIIIIYCITAAVYTMCTHIIYGMYMYGGRKGLSSSLLWRFRDGAGGVDGTGAVRRGVAAARELVRVKDELCWYKSARFWQFAATAAAYGQEVDFDLRVDHVGRLQWRHPITSSAQFVCHIYTEFMARSHLSFVSAIVYRKHTRTHTRARDNWDSHTFTLFAGPARPRTTIFSCEHNIFLDE